jgi:hypothetical protein
MRNLWVTHDEGLAEWVADLSNLSSEGERLFEWLRIVLDAGQRHEVYIVREAPLVGYSSTEERSFTDLLEQRFKENGEVDIFHFASSGALTVGSSRFRTAARVAYYDLKGQLTESEEDDLGALLRRFRPEDEREAPNAMLWCPPIEAIGPLIDLQEPTRSIWRGKPGSVRIRFIIRSDIWYPWVIGFLEEEVNVRRRYDNRPLSLRHTPRLNAFLTIARQATLELGGAWELDEERRWDFDGLLTEEGIDLDVEPPDGVMPVVTNPAD